MKSAKKILAAFLAVVLLLSGTSLLASAATAQSVGTNSIYDGDALVIEKTYRVHVGDTVKLDKVAGAEYADAMILGDNADGIDFTFKAAGGTESFTAVQYGVYLMHTTYIKWIYDAAADDYIVHVVKETDALIIVEDPLGMGEVTTMAAHDETFRYKQSSGSDDNYVWANPNVETKNNDEAYYTVVYVPDDLHGSAVRFDGSVYTKLTNKSHCTVYVLDAAGHILHDTCTITVKYVWWQQLIRIFLFGFIWY